MPYLYTYAYGNQPLLQLKKSERKNKISNIFSLSRFPGKTNNWRSGFEDHYFHFVTLPNNYGSYFTTRISWSVRVILPSLLAKDDPPLGLFRIWAVGVTCVLSNYSLARKSTRVASSTFFPRVPRSEEKCYTAFLSRQQQLSVKNSHADFGTSVKSVS